ncbi:hypothetical protein CARUB_v10027131mg [Capsella rubella]|uniref:ZF-HD dimerization-type domain-containing protein n=1 Tax=Capsella rubella TaxID=81985 RepID=R0GBJ6_9BRAS|nr:zinc-finger homeodomain protein 13 [Capsella rubella]EOA13999.1 hypothetical protein CARUB_v10027131mg [Capsella rubella]
MDETTKPKKQEDNKPKRRRNIKPICRESGDHVHYPPTHNKPKLKPKPSPILKVTQKPHYTKCMKNHAAGIGTTAYDGCGEFVVKTEEKDSLNCAACGCHRDFHREVVSETVLEVLKISSVQFRRIFCSPYGGGNSKVKKEEIDGEELVGRVKRLKTKFTAEQTEKMREYAEKLRWKMKAEVRNEVEEFCVEIGVNRKNFRIWMNNHKDKK